MLTLPLPPELPRVVPERPVLAPRRPPITVPEGGDLQAAIDRAVPGDVIELARGATYTGNYWLPVKGGDARPEGWITIRPAPGPPLPPAGTRMTPPRADALRLPRLVPPNNVPVFQTALAAHHYYLLGLDISVGTQPDVNTLVAFGTDSWGGHQNTLADVAHHLVLDRSLVRGAPGATLRRGVALNAGWSAVVDSWVSDVHEQGSDAQAVAGWNGPGPYRIDNNYLESSTEVIVFGGTDPASPELSPADVTVTRNMMTRPLAWRGVWGVKTIFELKNARRVLVEGNILEHCWADVWDGSAVALKSVNQGGSAPYSGTLDVTVRRNLIRDVGSGINISSNPQNPRDQVTLLARVAVTDNLLLRVAEPPYDGARRSFEVLGNVSDVAVTHNTVWTPAASINTLTMGQPGDQTTRFRFDDNLIATPENYGITADAVGDARHGMATYAPDGSMRGNAIAGRSDSPEWFAQTYPDGNRQIPFADVGFAPDLSLLPTSPLHGTATDGRDPGADIASVLAATAGVEDGTPAALPAALPAASAPLPAGPTTTPSPPEPHTMTPSFADRIAAVVAAFKGHASDQSSQLAARDQQIAALTTERDALTAQIAADAADDAKLAASVADAEAAAGIAAPAPATVAP